MTVNRLRRMAQAIHRGQPFGHITLLIITDMEVKNLMGGGTYSSPAIEVIALQLEEAVLFNNSNVGGGAGFDDLSDGGSI